jgi:hypothetical protein
MIADVSGYEAGSILNCTVLTLTRRMVLNIGSHICGPRMPVGHASETKSRAIKVTMTDKIQYTVDKTNMATIIAKSHFRARL